MYSKLLNLEEEVKQLYLFLANLEMNGQKNSELYKLNMQRIIAIIDIEKGLLISLGDNYHNIKDNIEANLINLPINLGYNTQAHLVRLHKLLEGISGDDGIEYADALYYDINKILLSFLECMIDNPYYENIRKSLIFLKYDIIFSDYNIESDFLIQLEENRVSLNCKRLRNSLPCSKYIEKAILVCETLELLKQVKMVLDVKEKYSLIVVNVLQIFARISLCDEELLKYVMDDINYLLENDEVNETVKEIIMQVLEMFRQIKDNFYFSR